MKNNYKICNIVKTEKGERPIILIENNYNDREELEIIKLNKSQQKTLQLIELWQKKGREILTEDKWEYWNKIIPIRLNDLYHGMELGCCLDVVQILNNNGTFKEAKKKIESQNHSGMSFGLVCSMVEEFCVKGSEFVDYLK